MREIASVFTVLVPAILFGALGWSIGWGIGAGAAAALFLNFEKVKSLKYKGLEIELRQAIKEAYATTESVKRIAKTLLLAAMHDLNHSGRIAGKDDSERHRMRDELDVLARDLGIENEPDVHSARQDFYRLHIWDRFDHFVHTFVKDHHAVLRNLQALSHRATTNYPTEADLRGACAGIYDALEADQIAARDEYLRYLKQYAVVSKS